MKAIIAVALAPMLAAHPAFANIQPIPGSITYEKPNVQLDTAPAGSTFFHIFAKGDGRDVREIYRINPDKTVTLINHAISNAS